MTLEEAYVKLAGLYLQTFGLSGDEELEKAVSNFKSGIVNAGILDLQATFFACVINATPEQFVERRNIFKTIIENNPNLKVEYSVASPYFVK